MAVWSEVFGHHVDWRGPSPHCYGGGLAGSHGLVEHIASGFYEGTIAWQLTATTNPTSSHWVVGRDGSIAQMLDTNDASWAQATGNRTWHSVENEGFGVDDPQHATHSGWERLTDAQLDANAALYAYGHLELGWPLQLATSPSGRGLGHHSMGAPDWGHAFCPGDPIVNQKQAILDRAVALLNPQEDAMSNAIYQLPQGFAFDPNGNLLSNSVQPGAKQYILSLPVDNATGQDVSIGCDLGAVTVRLAYRQDGGNWVVKLVKLDSTMGRQHLIGTTEIPKSGLITIGRCMSTSTDADPYTPAGLVINTHA